MTSKTIALSGAEIRADYSGGTNAWLRNDGTATVYASTAPGVTAGADGVVSIPAGQAAAIYGACGSVYLLGTGSVQLVGSDYTACPFKTSAQGGLGADDVARAAIGAHAGNADIHVSAAQKATWDGKAELSDIPTTLPANGGNADTLGGKHASDFAQYYADIATVDCNDATLMGTYNAVPSTINTPASNFWLITVEIGADGKCIKQTATLMDNIHVGTKEIYHREYINDGWNPWCKISDGGNAAMLDSHPASDFVLKAEYDTLAARVAALEGGN